MNRRGIKTHFNRLGGDARDDRVRRDILGDNRARAYGRAIADRHAGQHGDVMPDPDIVTDRDGVRLAPREELEVVRVAKTVLLGAVGHVVRTRTLERVIARIQPHETGDGAKLADSRVDRLTMLHDVTVIAQCRLVKLHVVRDLRPNPEARADDFGAWVNGRLLTEHQASSSARACVVGSTGCPAQ